MYQDGFETVTGELMGVPGAPPASGSKGSRGEIEKQYKYLPQHVRNGLAQKNLRFGDTLIYTVKPAKSLTIKMFETQDIKATGLRSLSGGKLPKDMAFLLSGIFLLAGQANSAVPGNPTEDEVKSINFRSLATYPALVNGNFSFRANQVQLIPETGLRIFATDGDSTRPMGYYKLHNPRLIHDETTLESVIELGTMAGIPVDTHIYMGLYGTITTP